MDQTIVTASKPALSTLTLECGGSPVRIETRPDPKMRVFSPHSEAREPGVHVSDLIKVKALELYPSPYAYYLSEVDETDINMFSNGLVLEEAWGDYLSEMIGWEDFERPEPAQEEGVWYSPDGLGRPGASGPVHWPDTYPAYTAPAIHECKVTQKSANLEKADVTHVKYRTWVWQVAAYCYATRCFTAYLYSLHIMGDYKRGGDGPPKPRGLVRRFDFDAPTLAQHWAWLMTAKPAVEALLKEKGQ